MFVLSLLSDKVKVAAEVFDRDHTDAVMEQLERKYVNRVLATCGLVVAIYDLLDATDPVVHPNEGCCHQWVKFRVVVFRPFIGEIVMGTVLSSDVDGIRISCGFFDNIYIPRALLQQPSEFDTKVKLWHWKYDVDAPGEFYTIEPGQKIRFRVRKVEFDVGGAAGTRAVVESEGDEQNRDRFRGNKDADAAATEALAPPAMSITGCVNEDGLGMLSWWHG